MDDFQPWRNALWSILQDQPGLQLVGEASNGLAAVKQANELQPDLIVLDLHLPDINGLEVAKRVQQVAPNARVLFVTSNQQAELVLTALSVGAKGYVLKMDAARDLLLAIRAAFGDSPFVSPGIKIRIN